MMMWDTTEGGPCLLRPSGSRAADSPDPEHETTNCVAGYDQDWQPILRQSSDLQIRNLLLTSMVWAIKTSHLYCPTTFVNIFTIKYD